MKKIIKNIQENASDEEKLTYAFSVALLVAVALFASFPFALKNDFQTLANKENKELGEKKNDGEKENLQKASAIESLNASVFEIIKESRAQEDKDRDENNNEQENAEIKRKPYKIEI